MKLLFVIDMQNDFIDGVLGSPEAQAIVPKVIEKIKQQKDIIVYSLTQSQFLYQKLLFNVAKKE